MVCADKPAPSETKQTRYATFSYFCGINVLPGASFQLPVFNNQLTKFLKIL